MYSVCGPLRVESRLKLTHINVHVICFELSYAPLIHEQKTPVILSSVTLTHESLICGLCLSLNLTFRVSVHKLAYVWSPFSLVTAVIYDGTFEITHR